VFFPAWCAGVILLHPLFSLAQKKGDTLTEVNIRAAGQKAATDIRKSFGAGQQRQQFDSTLLPFYQGASVARLVAEQSAVFVKSYGVNSMSTLSFRGASAAQSAVLWNGIPIANPALGVSDISILSSGLFDALSVQYGGAAALYGSGNVGGALLLENTPPDFTMCRSANLDIGGGSFGERQLQGSFLFQNRRWRVKANGFYEAAQNDFPYQDQRHKEQRMDNARMHGSGGIFSADYNLGLSKASRQTLSVQLWYQQYEREIPPALFEVFSVKRQTDRSVRSFLEWQKTQGRHFFYAKISLNKDDLLYEDGVVLPDNKNRAVQLYGEAGWRWKINAPGKFYPGFRGLLQELLLFAPLQYSWAIGENTPSHRTQWRPAVAAAWQARSRDERLHISADLRTEWQGSSAPAWLPGAGGQYRFFVRELEKSKWEISARVNVQKSYRLPTINELYFFPGGNENLLPEAGWSEDGGLDFYLRIHKEPAGSYRWILENQTSFFNRDIRNWIYWLGGAIWTPHNLAEVHSRGIETNSTLRWQQQRVKIALSLKTAYVLSTTAASYLPNDNSVGKQIPYVPRYNGQANLTASFAGFLCNYNHTYTGYRYTTTDESQFLDPYQAGNLQAGYTFGRKGCTISLMVQVLNLWDTRYEIINGRPMPGRNFSLMLRLAWRQG